MPVPGKKDISPVITTEVWFLLYSLYLSTFWKLSFVSWTLCSFTPLPWHRELLFSHTKRVKIGPFPDFCCVLYEEKGTRKSSKYNLMFSRCGHPHPRPTHHSYVSEMYVLYIAICLWCGETESMLKASILYAILQRYPMCLSDYRTQSTPVDWTLTKNLWSSFFELERIFSEFIERTGLTGEEEKRKFVPKGKS
jgi:hypothetical protein